MIPALAPPLLVVFALFTSRRQNPQLLLVAGYDANAYVQPLLQSNQMFATVDQNPSTGFVCTLQVLLSPHAKNGGVTTEDTNDKDAFCAYSLDASCSLDDYAYLRRAAWNQVLSTVPDMISTGIAIRIKDPATLVLRHILST